MPVSKLGVSLISKADVIAVNCDEEGYITSVTTEQAGDISGDIFIDCTGFKSMLLGEHYGVPIKTPMPDPV
jgi:glycine/D-amino acid oxidase-like deaminating enzyme